MSGSKMNDLFMYMTDHNGKDMKGESSLRIARSSALETMMTEFKSAEYDNYSNFFDLTDFDFSIELEDTDKTGGSDSVGPHADWYMHKNPLESFANQRNDPRNNQYKLKKVSGTFGKVVDSVSPILFQNCCLKRPFQKAILVKRAFTGATARKDDSSALGYLRIFMTNVMITNVSWNDGDVVEEKIRFKCEHMEVYYRKQENPGRLDKQIELLNWTWSRGAGKS